MFILLDTFTKLSCHLIIIYDKLEQEWNRHLKSTDNHYPPTQSTLPNSSFSGIIYR